MGAVSEELLAGAAFPQDQDRQISVGEAFESPQGSGERGTRSDDAFRRRSPQADGVIRERLEIALDQGEKSLENAVRCRGVGHQLAASQVCGQLSRTTIAGNQYVLLVSADPGQPGAE